MTTSEQGERDVSEAMRSLVVHALVLNRLKKYYQSKYPITIGWACPA
jgi:hypothetical protein